MDIVMTHARSLLVVALVLAGTTCLGQESRDRTLDAPSDEERARIVVNSLTDPHADGNYKDFRNRGETSYHLMMLGDAATPLLVEVLGSDDDDTRYQALELFMRHGTVDALEPLTARLARESNAYTPLQTWVALSAISPNHANEAALALLKASLPLNPTDTRCEILARNGDSRVIPYLRAFLGGMPSRHRVAAEMLAKLRDADGVTALIELWEAVNHKKARQRRAKRARIFATLSHSGDERVIPIAMWTIRSSAEAVSASPMPRDFGSRLAPHLLRGVRPAADTYLSGLNNALKAIHEGQPAAAWKGVPPLPEHVELYARALLKRQREPAARPSSTPDVELRRTIAQALASLGTEGRARLGEGARNRYAYRESLAALASYNDVEAVGALARPALDASYAYRKDALSAFASVAWLWEEAAEAHWLALLADDTIGAADACLTYISRGRPGNATALLNVLMEHDDQAIRERALRLHGVYVESPGKDPREDLEVRIALDRETYAYDDDITLSVEVSNAGARPVTISTTLFGAPESIGENVKIELVMPDGDVRVFLNHGSGPHVGSSSQTLQPGESISADIDVQAHCRPAQAGAYGMTVSYGHAGNSTKRGLRYARSPVAVSTTLTFALRPPSRAYIDSLLAEIDVSSLTDESLYGTRADRRRPVPRVVNRKRRDPDVFRSIATPIYQLGEFREPRALEPLRVLATLPRGAGQSSTGTTWRGLRAVLWADTTRRNFCRCG